MNVFLETHGLVVPGAQVAHRGRDLPAKMTELVLPPSVEEAEKAFHVQMTKDHAAQVAEDQAMAEDQKAEDQEDHAVWGLGWGLGFGRVSRRVASLQCNHSLIRDV